MYIKVTDAGPVRYSFSLLRANNPQTSFPESPSDALLAEWGVFRCQETDKPEVNHTRNVEETFVNEGGWKQTWTISEASVEEIEERTRAMCRLVREERNILLAASDWTQVADAPVDKSAWATYRQALRDITTQDGFPHNVTWPVQP